MPRLTRKRQPTAETLYADDGDSGGDTEVEETPRPTKTNHSKRRFSEINVEKDFSPDSGRQPLRAVNMNDDEAEKRRRRKSAKVVYPDNAEAGPSSEGATAATDTMAPPGLTRQKTQLASVAQTPIINVPRDVMSSNFEEWMKMATDNKINAANSWNFALIDYFHDMSLLRNNTDNSINFQRASCTLDGCVKIWTSRVDSVGTEAGRLHSNLADEGNNLDDEEAGSDNPDGADPSQPKRTRTHRQESTLAKNAAQLRSKKLDLEFSVDPLFKKTCADFDEGGAHGLLMNHLSLGVGSEGGLRVVFDASDSMVKDGEGDDEPALEPDDPIDLTEIRAQFMPDLDMLDQKAINHSLAGFSFSKDAFSFESSLYRDDTNVDYDDGDDGDDGFLPMDTDGGAGETQDFFVGDQAIQDDFGGDYGGDDFGGDTGSAGAESGEQNGGPARAGTFVPFDPARAPNERDLVMAMTDADAEGGMMNYFDQNFLKNWAGPEHWKLRRAVRRPENTEAAAPKAKREKKEAFKIDFFTPSEMSVKDFAKEKFAPVTRGAGINLPGYGPAAATASKASASKKGSKKSKEKEKDKRVDQILPDDMHFTSRQLVTLYLKPKFSLKMRGQRVPTRGDGDGEIDENFWAQAAANQAAGGNGQDGDETADGGAIPFNTQFFHDDYDDGPGFDDIDEGGPSGGGISADPEEHDLLAAVNGNTRRVRPQFVNYAKRAKRVDVRKLKENIWQGLKIVVPDTKLEDDQMETDQPPEVEPTDPSDSRVFDSVISNLRDNYPRDKMDEISTSFCFICLLHLANEKGLKIEVGENGEDAPIVEEGDNKVGDIWGLKVFRDPNATIGA